MNIGYAPTIDIPRVPANLRVTPRTTAPAPAASSPVREGTLVTYTGTSVKDHGHWIYDGACDCGCDGLKLWRRERDGLHRLVHVSARNVARSFR